MLCKDLPTLIIYIYILFGRVDGFYQKQNKTKRVSFYGKIIDLVTIENKCQRNIEQPELAKL